MKTLANIDLLWRRGPKSVEILILILLLGAPGIATTEGKEATADTHIQARISALEVLWNHVEVTRDAKALNQLLADRFIFVTIDGILQTRSEFIESVRNPPEHSGKMTSESLQVEVYGGTVVVSGIYKERGASNGKGFSRRGRFTDTWIKQGKSWLCIASQSTLIHKS
jgi:ketosteroid isomerase-like protein